MSAAGTAETPPRLLPPLELAAMRSLWRLERATVAEVRQAMESERELAYTTVLTLLDRLTQKGAVSRRKRGRGFVYEPLLDRQAEREHAVHRLINEHFDGSRRELRAYLDQETSGGDSTSRLEAQPLDSALL